MINDFNQIKGFLDPEEGKTLFEFCKSSFQNGICAEIGSYCGKSACYIGQACKEIGSKLYSVDHHKGSEEQQLGEEYFDEEIFDYEANEVNTLPLFLSNIKRFQLTDFIEPVIMNSTEASKFVPDNLDFVFIDGSHTFESARKDYTNWAKKLRDGGILAIHDIYDSEEEGGQAPREIYLKALNEGFELLKRTKSLVVLQR